MPKISSFICSFLPSVFQQLLLKILNLVYLPTDPILFTLVLCVRFVEHSHLPIFVCTAATLTACSAHNPSLVLPHVRALVLQKCSHLLQGAQKRAAFPALVLILTGQSPILLDMVMSAFNVMNCSSFPATKR